jgi:CxxC-x17-CxxC domain-containing protein
MKKPKDQANVLDTIIKLQEQISAIDKKMDIVMGRIMSTPALLANVPKPQPQNQPVRERPEYKITCTDCGKEAVLHFKPTQGRPVYCKECFLLRKKNAVAANVGPIRAEEGYPKITPAPQPATTQIKAPLPKLKKKAAAKRAVTKTRPATKRKK